jgi:predicted cupin superfamily sugar epimerase
MALSPEVEQLIADLKLAEHPEGGWYRETYRSPMTTDTPLGPRNLATLIYYLLPAGIESRIHKVSWDEIWLWQGGGVLDVRSYKDDKYQSHLLGHRTGAVPQQLMPAGTWFNAVVAEGDYVLAACMVAPGFDFADLTMS